MLTLHTFENEKLRIFKFSFHRPHHLLPSTAPKFSHIKHRSKHAAIYCVPYATAAEISSDKTPCHLNDMRSGIWLYILAVHCYNILCVRPCTCILCYICLYKYVHLGEMSAFYLQAANMCLCKCRFLCVCC